MVNNKITAIWTDICNNGAESKELLEELDKFHEIILKRKLNTDQEAAEEEAMEQRQLKDPAVGDGKSVQKGNRLKHPAEPIIEEKKKNASKKKKKL